MKLYEFLKPLHEFRKENGYVMISSSNHEVYYKGEIKYIPYLLFEREIEFWSYNFRDRINIILK